MFPDQFVPDQFVPDQFVPNQCTILLGLARYDGYTLCYRNVHNFSYCARFGVDSSLNIM